MTIATTRVTRVPLSPERPSGAGRIGRRGEIRLLRSRNESAGRRWKGRAGVLPSGSCLPPGTARPDARVLLLPFPLARAERASARCRGGRYKSESGESLAPSAHRWPMGSFETTDAIFSSSTRSPFPRSDNMPHREARVAWRLIPTSAIICKFRDAALSRCKREPCSLARAGI